MRNFPPIFASISPKALAAKVPIAGIITGFRLTKKLHFFIFLNQTTKNCKLIDNSRDIFGRPRFATHKEDCDGFGSFMHETRTL